MKLKDKVANITGALRASGIVVAIRPIGCIKLSRFLKDLDSTFAFCVIGVSTNPGHRAFIRILDFAYSRAIDFVNPISACLLTESGVSPNEFPINPEVEEIFYSIAFYSKTRNLFRNNKKN